MGVRDCQRLEENSQNAEKRNTETKEKKDYLYRKYSVALKHLASFCS